MASLYSQPGPGWTPMDDSPYDLHSVLDRIGTLRRAGERPLGNPYLDLWAEQRGSDRDEERERRARAALIGIFACAIPNEDAIATIARHSPQGVIEIGAGTGYWARLLTDAGVAVRAADSCPHGCRCGGVWCGKPVQWTDVERGGVEIAGAEPNRSLMLSWPPLSSSMATVALLRHHGAGGATVIYIGEWRGRTADFIFHDLLERFYEKVVDLPIPRWSAYRDSLMVFERRRSGPSG